MQVGGGDDEVRETYARARGGDGSEESIWASPSSSDVGRYGKIMMDFMLLVMYLRVERNWWERLFEISIVG